MNDCNDPDQDEPSAHAYFQAIEELFIGLRGAPLLLSPADYRVASEWHGRGVPLDLIRQTLRTIFEGRRERGVKGMVSSLRYCARAVDQAWEEAEELSSSARRQEEAEPDLAARLDALASSLAASRASAPAIKELAERIRGLTGPSPQVEKALAGLDEELLRSTRSSLDEGGQQQLAEELEQALTALASRLPAEELERARERLERQILRRQLSLPVLSLFSPEADP